MKRKHTVKGDQAEAERLLAKWQARLGLRDWDVRVTVSDDPPDDCLIGLHHGVPSKRTALISVMSRHSLASFGPLGHRRDEFEQLIVHELLHCFTCVLDELIGKRAKSPPVTLAIEQMVDAIAWTLVESDRCKP